MSWGDLLACVVREAVTRHNPRGGGSGQRRRRSAGSAGASPRRAPKETRTAGPAGGPAQRVDESSGRTPNRTPAAVAPVAPAPRRGGATPAPLGNTAATERQNPIGVLANAAPPSQSAPAAPFDGARAGGVPSDASAATAAPQAAPAVLSDGARAGGAPSGAPAATAAPKFASGALADGSRAGTAVPGSPVATSAPERALGVSPDGGPSGASDGAAGVVSAAGFSSRAGVPGSPVATAAAKSVLGVLPDGGPPDASAGAAEHTTREPVHSRHHSPPRRHIPAAVRRHVWLRDGGRCCYRDPLSGRRCTSSHLLQIDHLLPVAEGGGPEPSNLESVCAQLITECATATDRWLRRSPQCSASCARLARHSTALADRLQVARRGYPSQRREPTVHLRYRLFRPGLVAVDALMRGVVVVSRLRLPAASGVRTRRKRRLTSLGERAMITSSGIERMPMKRHDDSQRSGRLTVTQPVHHIVPPYPRTPVPPYPRTPVPPGLFHIL